MPSGSGSATTEPPYYAKLGRNPNRRNVYQPSPRAEALEDRFRSMSTSFQERSDRGIDLELEADQFRTTTKHGYSSVIALDDIVSSITCDREVALEFFWLISGSGALEPIDMVNDKKMLKTSPNLPSLQVGPDVDICPENRIGIHRLHYATGARLLGQFLLCRTLTPAFNSVWVDVIVDDPDGNAGILRLVNFTPTKYCKTVKSGKGSESCFLPALPSGSYIVVKNPVPVLRLAKNEPFATFVAQVNCHSPADVVLLSDTKMKDLFPGLCWTGGVPTGSFWDDKIGMVDYHVINFLKRIGDEALAFKRFTDAIRCYDLALDYVDVHSNSKIVKDHVIPIWNNKAAAFLGLECFQKAVECCEEVLVRDRFHINAICQKVRALVGLGDCSQARNFFDETIRRRPFLIILPEMANLSNKIPPGLKVESDELMAFAIDTLGPVEFRPDPITGRGVFATEDIAPGEVTIAMQRLLGKAVAIAIMDEQGNELSAAELVSLIANKIAFAPEFGPEVYKLWAGNEFKRLESSDPEIYKVHIGRIQKLVDDYAVFSPDNTLSLNTVERPSTYAWGLSPFLSRLNHSCVGANIESRYHDNWTFVRATKPIKKGEEILTQWIPVTTTLERRREDLTNRGLICNCDLCKRDAKDGADVKRKYKKLWTRFNAKLAQQTDFQTCSRQKIDSVLAIVQEIENLRKDSPHLNAIMIEESVASISTDLYNRQDMYLPKNVEFYLKFSKKIVTVAETLNHLDLVYSVGTNMIKQYLHLKMFPEAIEYAKKVKKCSVILYGKTGEGFNWDDELLSKLVEAGLNPEDL